MAGGADDAEDDDDEPPSADDAWGLLPEFAAASKCQEGGYLGMVFQKGPRGLGYYRVEPSKHAWYQKFLVDYAKIA